MAVTRYVNLNNTTPAAPYTDWTTAATNIQDAVNAAGAGEEIVVTNGVYSAGTTVINGTSNRVAIIKSVIVRSVNGPAVTIIRGGTDVRCVYLTNNAVLSGFTLTNGSTLTTGDYYTNRSGGGVWCESISALVTNCVLTGNSANGGGSGAYNGTLNNCAISNNIYASSDDLLNAKGGGVYGSILDHCFLAGNVAWKGSGAANSILNNCLLTGNTGAYEGGGAYGSILNNCLLTENGAVNGGGAAGSSLNNCTISGNVAYNTYQGGVGGGVYGGTLNNCILYYNSGSFLSQANYSNGSYVQDRYTPYTALSNCCTTPLPARGNNFANAPVFVNSNGWANLRLQANSPCINAGGNAAATSPTDLDANPRIVAGTVDVGAYEFQSPASAISYLWLQQYGLPTDGSADQSDYDADAHTTWQEWITGTNPTNAASALRMLSISNTSSGIAVTWSSVTNRAYSLERATNLAASPAFGLVAQSNLTGLNGSTTITDTNSAGSGPFFYRVRVQP
ncbi:MAG: choice-of-anchor Q domain-containing protein [Verrucomicrobiota bacterium]